MLWRQHIYMAAYDDLLYQKSILFFILIYKNYLKTLLKYDIFLNKKYFKKYTTNSYTYI